MARTDRRGRLFTLSPSVLGCKSGDDDFERGDADCDGRIDLIDGGVGGVEVIGAGVGVEGMRLEDLTDVGDRPADPWPTWIRTTTKGAWLLTHRQAQHVLFGRNEAAVAFYLLENN